MSIDTPRGGAGAAFETALESLASQLTITREQLVTRILTQRADLVQQISRSPGAMNALQNLYPDTNERNIDSVLNRLQSMVPMARARELTQERTTTQTPDARQDTGRSLNRGSRGSLTKKLLALAVGGVALWVAWPYIASWMHRQFTRVPQSATELAMGTSRAVRQADPLITPTPTIPDAEATSRIIGPRPRGPILSPNPGDM